MISGKGYYELCKWNFCDRYPVNLEIDKIAQDDFVFINLDDLDKFLLSLNSVKIKNKINLITHNSDLSFTDSMFNKLAPFCNKIFSLNSISKHGIKIPMGFSDYLIDIMTQYKGDVEKTSLVYLNFKIYKNEVPERHECFNTFKTKDWAMKSSNVPTNIFYNELQHSKYCLCPVGIGLDTHRFYESIYLNSVPIVKRNLLSVGIHNKFPCMIIDDWEEITQDVLENSYEFYFQNLMKWKHQNPRWTDPSFWIKI
jgi:hypothetical protein